MGKSRGPKAKKKNYKSSARANKTKNLKLFDDQIHLSLRQNSVKMIVDKLEHDGVSDSFSHFCISCGRHFSSLVSLTSHYATKQHKRTVKRLTAKPFTHEECQYAAGVGNYPSDFFEFHPSYIQSKPKNNEKSSHNSNKSLTNIKYCSKSQSDIDELTCFKKLNIE